MPNRYVTMTNTNNVNWSNNGGTTHKYFLTKRVNVEKLLHNQNKVTHYCNFLMKPSRIHNHSTFFAKNKDIIDNLGDKSLLMF